MLSAAVDAYLAGRRAAGFQLNDHEGILRDFARFASAQADAVVRTRTVLEWVRACGGSPLRRCVRLRTVVHFARYLQAQEAGVCESLFLSRKGRKLHANTVRHVFRRLVRCLGIAGNRPAASPAS